MPDITPPPAGPTTTAWDLFGPVPPPPNAGADGDQGDADPDPKEFEDLVLAFAAGW